MRWTLALSCLCVVVSCRGGGAAESSSSDAGRRPSGARSGSAGARPAWPADAPPASACEKDDDCTVVVWDGPQPPDPCCDARVGYLPVARAHLRFIEAYRKTACVGVSCPPSPFPGAEPACCASISRCVDRKCVSACTLAGEPVPKVSVLDPACDSYREAPRVGTPVVPSR